MNKDTIEGKAEETGGKIRSAVDHAVGDKKGETLGKIDQATGKAQYEYGKLKEKAEDAFK